jgi:hypothetical protein
MEAVTHLSNCGSSGTVTHVCLVPQRAHLCDNLESAAKTISVSVKKGWHLGHFWMPALRTI